MNRRDFLKQSSLFSLAALVIPVIPLHSSDKVKALRYSLISPYEDILSKHPITESEPVIIIDGKKQELYLINGKRGISILNSYSISTSEFGFGSKSGSYKTPLGLFKIKNKHGKDAPLGTIFNGKYESNEVAKIIDSKTNSSLDLITSRILTLDGLESHNVNTSSRHIYIHGTDEEGFIGQPASHGCIRMKNDDVIGLFDIVNKGTYVNIKEEIKPYVRG